MVGHIGRNGKNLYFLFFWNDQLLYLRYDVRYVKVDIEACTFNQMRYHGSNSTPPSCNFCNRFFNQFYLKHPFRVLFSFLYFTYCRYSILHFFCVKLCSYYTNFFPFLTLPFFTSSLFFILSSFIFQQKMRSDY